MNKLKVIGFILLSTITLIITNIYFSAKRNMKNVENRINLEHENKKLCHEKKILMEQLDSLKTENHQLDSINFKLIGNEK